MKLTNCALFLVLPLSACGGTAAKDEAGVANGTSSGAAGVSSGSAAGSSAFTAASHASSAAPVSSSASVDGSTAGASTTSSRHRSSRPPSSQATSTASLPATSGAGSGPSSTSTVAASSSSGVAPAHWVTGYYVGYHRTIQPVAQVDATNLTHVAVGACLPRADGTLDTSFNVGSAAQGLSFATDVATAVHAQGKKVIIMLGGAGANAGFVGAASVAHRDAFVTNLHALLTSTGADGFDLDWEPVATADEPNLLALATALRNTIPGVILTIPVAWLNANFPTVDAFFVQLAAQVDQINIMSYGMADAWSGWRSWHSSALTGESANTPSSVLSSIQGYLTAGVPAAKLGVGVGAYGSCWTGVTAPGQAVTGANMGANDNTMAFNNIMRQYHSAGVYQYDNVAKAPYLSSATPLGPQGCTFLSYEDETSVGQKAQAVVDHGLGGAIVWTISEGYFNDRAAGQRDPLLKALGDVLLR